MPIKHPAHHPHSGVPIKIGKVIVQICCCNEKIIAKKVEAGDFDRQEQKGDSAMISNNDRMIGTLQFRIQSGILAIWLVQDRICLTLRAFLQNP